MAPKKKSGKEKKKGNQLFVEPEHLLPFGVKAGDLLRTPLGETVQVAGVKYDTPGNMATARLFVTYRTGLSTVLELNAGALTEGTTIEDLGYSKLSDTQLVAYMISQQAEDKQEQKSKSRVKDLINSLAAAAAAKMGKKKKKKGVSAPQPASPPPGPSLEPAPAEGAGAT